MRRSRILVGSLLCVLAVFGCGGSSGVGAAGASGAAGGKGSAGAGGAAQGAGGAGGTKAAGGTSGGNGAGGLAACGTALGQSGQCSTISVVPSGPCVTATRATGTAPTPSGGTVVAGTYNLTAVTVYGAPADASVQNAVPIGRETVVVSNVTSGSFTAALVQQAGTEIASTEYSQAISGSMLTATQTCPPAGDAGASSAPASFTATSTTIDVFISTGTGVTVVESFQKAS
jgi:fibronectin-binding autotransporter adhesin